MTSELSESQKLKESEAKFKMLYNSSQDAIMTLSLEEGFLGGNPSTIKMFNCDNEAEFIKLSPAEVSPERQPDGTLSGEKAKEMMDIAMETGSNFFEWTHKRKGGENFFATVLLTKMELQGKPVLQATVRDITEKKQAEATLKEQMKKLERMNKQMVGRELKMVKLKKEIKELKGK